MKAKPRKLTRQQQAWLTQLQRAEARNVPLAQYCRTQGVSVQSLYNARYELTRKRPTVSKPASRRTRSASAFIAVQMAPSVVVPAAACRVRLKDVMIECTSLPPPAWLVGLARGVTDAVP